MPDKGKDQWRAVKEQALGKCFKLGSVFYWQQEKHWFLFVGPADDTGMYSFFVGGSSQPYWDKPNNFPIVPEDFRTASIGTKSRALTKTTYFLFSQYLRHRHETAQLREQYLNGNLEYKFNFKADLPDTYTRLVDFIINKLPPAYAKRILDTSNILPDKHQS
jgi:hypothetical protein